MNFAAAMMDDTVIVSVTPTRPVGGHRVLVTLCKVLALFWRLIRVAINYAAGPLFFG